MTRQQRPIRARYVGYAKGTKNHGDETLLWIIRDLLAPEIDVSFDAAVEDFNIALLGGGTLINQSPWLIDVFESALDQACLGVVLGTGVGDLAFWGNHFDRWTPLLQRCELIGVRGPDSLTLLQDHGVENADCVGDPYLWLHSPVKREPVPCRLGVNVGSTNDSLWGTTDQDLIDFLVEVLVSLESKGWSFEWFSVWEDDLPLMENLRSRVGSETPLLDTRTQTLEAYSALARCEVFLGEKLHANAMAAVAGVPFIALEYQPKVRDFAASLGMESCVVSTADRDALALMEKIELLGEGRESVRNRMISTRDRLRRNLDGFVQRIKEKARQVVQKPG